jgi:hypothetical protein
MPLIIKVNRQIGEKKKTLRRMIWQAEYGDYALTGKGGEPPYDSFH